MIIEPHRWWDRRMGLIDNLSYGFVRPAICLIRGHRFEWWDVVENGDWQRVVSQFAICSTCARCADRDVLRRGEDV